MHSSLLFLFLIAPLADTASAAGEEPIALCEAVAMHVKSVVGDLRALERPQGQDYDDYDALLAPIISLPAPELADGELWAKVKELPGGDQDTVVEVQHVDGPVWRAVQVAGTAHCERRRVFFLRPDGGLLAPPTPPGVR